MGGEYYVPAASHVKKPAPKLVLSLRRGRRSGAPEPCRRQPHTGWGRGRGGSRTGNACCAASRWLRTSHPDRYRPSKREQVKSSMFFINISTPGAFGGRPSTWGDRMSPATSTTRGFACGRCGWSLRSELDAPRVRVASKVITLTAVVANLESTVHLAAVPRTQATARQTGLFIVISSYDTDLVAGAAPAESHASTFVLHASCHASESTEKSVTERSAGDSRSAGPRATSVPPIGGPGTPGAARGRPPGAGRAPEGKFPLSGISIQQG